MSESAATDRGKSIAVSTRKLCGHSDAVLCVAAGIEEQANIIVAGAESGQCPVRLWDMRIGGKRSQTAIANPSSQQEGGDWAINSVSLHSDKLLFCSSGRSLYAFDLRNSSKIIHSFASCVWRDCNFAADEINQICIKEHPEAKMSVACCDDAGDIHLYKFDGNDHGVPISDVSRMKLSGVHTNICMGITWDQKMNTLISGSLDTCVCVWSTENSKPTPLEVIACGELFSSAQTFNPPFVNSVDSTTSMFAAGLGDGTVAIFDSQSRSLRKKLSGHDAAVACVKFAPPQNEFPGQWLFSAGNDNRICLWHLGAEEVNVWGDSGETDKTMWTPGRGEASEKIAHQVRQNGKKSRKKKKKRSKKSKSTRKRNLGVGLDGDNDGDNIEKDGGEKNPLPPLRFRHQHKINWIEATKKNSHLNLYIADESPDVCVYSGFI